MPTLGGSSILVPALRHTNMPHILKFISVFVYSLPSVHELQRFTSMGGSEGAEHLTSWLESFGSYALQAEHNSFGERKHARQTGLLFLAFCFVKR